ncbi:hypothetical protein C4J81_03315 [Deltaproteobacteria bacterium Smac51]|nr:hypothetical protein C4J81_03315 [Deltaproteobacteria bacterium Smac51]
MPSQFIFSLLVVMFAADSNIALPTADEMAGLAGRMVLAQKKPHDPGNCFHWKGCKGDSIGAMWTFDPDRCKAIGGKSWMDEAGECYNLPDGAQVVTIPPRS